VASVVGLLLDKEDIRSTAEARRIFSSMPSLECVWTGVSLKDNFEVDHVIPFALWRNNDVWNLLPSSKIANSKKSNKLPSLELLTSRRNSIIGCWEFLKDRDDAQFDKEAETLMVLPKVNWQNVLFGQLTTAIEMTALQRGVTRFSI
jgi:CRISPR/Cas system Type II protein with McrA/HNH and RuvC-like nuclease domain